MTRILHWPSWARAHALAVLASALLAACGASDTKKPSLVIDPPASLSVAPATATVAVGGVTKTFTATVTNVTNTSVTWQVNGVTGGSSSLGTISSAGSYQSPATMPPSSSVTVTAVSVADSTVSGSATVNLTSTASVVSITVSPTSATLQAGTGTQKFTATVSNSTNTSVTWQVNGVTGGNATVGTIAASGVYTAPATVPAQPTVTITAISAADSTKTASAAVTITSQPVTVLAPTIGGTPGTSVFVSQTYTFTPTASDPQGLGLTFTVTGNPTWLTFNSATGQLTGTPTASNVGSSTIKITVSNGALTASLSFTLAVVQTTTGSASLTWTAPTARTDGTSLSNLSGYRIYYGTTSSVLSSRMDVTNATVTTATVPNLTSGTWYFSVTAVDATSVESARTNPVSVAVP